MQAFELKLRYVEHQNFCKETDWPPKSGMKLKMGSAGQSCAEVCESHDRRCELGYNFKKIL